MKKKHDEKMFPVEVRFMTNGVGPDAIQGVGYARVLGVHPSQTWFQGRKERRREALATKIGMAVLEAVERAGRHVEPFEKGAAA